VNIAEYPITQCQYLNPSHEFNKLLQLQILVTYDLLQQVSTDIQEPQVYESSSRCRQWSQGVVSEIKRFQVCQAAITVTDRVQRVAQVCTEVTMPSVR